MVASDQPRFLFWLAAAFIMVFVLYGVSSLLLPRLIRFNQLPESGELYVDNADVLATRIAYSVCNLWISRNSFNKGFESTSEYKSASGFVYGSTISSKFSDTECKDFLPGNLLVYSGDTINADKKIYAVKISLDPDTVSERKITVNVKRK